MPVTVRVMNWNIQTFGVTKAGIRYNNYDLIEGLARIVVESRCDIFVMLEMNTTRPDMAKRLAGDMLGELLLRGRDEDIWDLAVLSPNTGREFYAFFIRDRAKTVPLTISHPIDPFTDDPPLRLNQFDRLGDATFTAPDADDYDVLDGWFPLIEPDTIKYHHIPVWPGTRRPVLGMFHLPQASPANSILPIVACHYVPSPSFARMQFRTLPYFRMLRGLRPDIVPFGAPEPAPATTRVDTGNGAQQHTLNYYMLTGDFNVDYYPGSYSYSAITGGEVGQLAATGHIDDNTHLLTYRQYDPRVDRTTADLAVNDYDNFFTRIAPATPVPATTGNPRVINVPELVRNRLVTLNESVQHYQVLDKRGFSSGSYLNIVNDFARQIAGDRSHVINTAGALVGGRLFSDHLPTLVDITVN